MSSHRLSAERLAELRDAHEGCDDPGCGTLGLLAHIAAVEESERTLRDALQTILDGANRRPYPWTTTTFARVAREALSSGAER